MMESFKTVSISGRVAFGIHCLEAALKQYNYDTPEVRLILARIREFVEKDDLDVWERRVTEIAPSSILDGHPANIFEQYETISLEYLISLKKLYESMQSLLKDLIDAVIDIGKSNLYGGVGAYSEYSLREVDKVIDIMNDLQVPVPESTPYFISPFSENGGWGITRLMSDFEKHTT